MTNFAFLQKYQHLQHKIMLDKLVNLDFATVGYSKTDKSFFWNLALADQPLSDDQIAEFETRFTAIAYTKTIP